MWWLFSRWTMKEISVVWSKSYCFCFRSESPSSQRSSPPISPGCEDQMLDSHEPFKKPLPPMRPQEFPPFYGGYPYHLIQHGSSAFHRPIDASGKPLPVSKQFTNTFDGAPFFLSAPLTTASNICKPNYRQMFICYSTAHFVCLSILSRKYI